MSERVSRVRLGARTVEVPEGSPVLSAFGRGVPIVQRSIRFHRPRAAFCGVGYCTQCLVRVNGVPNVRACTYRPADGDRVSVENAWPSPRLDIYGILDFLFPRGIDTARGFRRPAFAVPLYQRVVRRLAGTGHLSDHASTPPRGPNPERATDVLVVGAGSSGRLSAKKAAQRGDSVAIVDRAPMAPASTDGSIQWSTTAVFLPGPQPGDGRPFRLITVGPEGAVSNAAREVVVATGSYDAGLWFAGSDRPGVLTADAALALTAQQGAPPFRRAMVFGTGPRVRLVLDRLGPAVDCVAAPGTIEPELANQAATLGVDLYPRILLSSASGRSRVRSVRLAPRGRGTPFDVAVDAVVLAHRRMPSVQLLFQAGAAMRFDRTIGAYLPVVSADGATSVPGLFAVGECAAGSPSNASPTPSPGSPASGIPGEMEGYYREFLSAPRPPGKIVACPCEDVLLPELEHASRKGYRGLEVVKRYTGLGTGLCQGRYCLPEALLALSIWEGRPPSEVGFITQRPPVVPVPLGDLARLPEAPETGEVE